MQSIPGCSVPATRVLESGRHAARRYNFVWHILNATFDNDRPIFSLFRQSALLPEGVSENNPLSALEDVSHCLTGDSIRLRTDLFSVGDLLNESVRKDWPFLAELSIKTRNLNGIPFRPALLVLLASYLGDSSGVEATLAGAAVELGYLSALAQLSVAEEPVEGAARGNRLTNWSNLFALTVAEFLLSQAYKLGTRAGTAVCATIAESLGKCCEGRVRELRHAFKLDVPRDEFLDILASKIGTLFELPCRLGALIAGLPHHQIENLANYGRQLGLAYQLSEDLLALKGKPTSLGLTSVTDFGEGLFSLPIRWALQQKGPHVGKLKKLLGQHEISSDHVAEVHSLVIASGVCQEILQLNLSFAQAARRALEPFPQSPAISAMTRLAHHVSARAEII